MFCLTEYQKNLLLGVPSTVNGCIRVNQGMNHAAKFTDCIEQFSTYVSDWPSDSQCQVDIGRHVQTELKLKGKTMKFK